MSLTTREKMILGEIVENFIASATPVSSNLIANKRKLNMSPATIRSVMSSLEQKGYIYQPHTSAGRVPKTLGYRTYVDELIKKTRLSNDEKGQICEPVQQLSSEFDEILKEITRILAHLSRQLGIILTPTLEQGIFQRMELISLSSNTILVVLTIESGLLKTVTVEIDSMISGKKLQLISQLLNERLGGMRIADIRSQFATIVKDIRSDDNSGLMQLFSQKAERLFDFGTQIDMHFMGTHYILQKADFTNREALSSVMELVENRKIIVHLMNEETQLSPLSVKIGEEIPEQRMQAFSMITASYRYGNVNGVLGVIGPTRMDYSKLVSLVEFTAHTLTEVYGRN